MAEFEAAATEAIRREAAPVFPSDERLCQVVAAEHGRVSPSDVCAVLSGQKSDPTLVVFAAGVVERAQRGELAHYLTPAA